jgi:hypothetical protein
LFQKDVRPFAIVRIVSRYRLVEVGGGRVEIALHPADQGFGLEGNAQLCWAEASGDCQLFLGVLQGIGKISAVKSRPREVIQAQGDQILVAMFAGDGERLLEWFNRIGDSAGQALNHTERKQRASFAY